MAFISGGFLLNTVVAEEDQIPFVEYIEVVVNCTTAEISISSLVLSNDTSLVCFHPDVNLGRVELLNALSVSVVFSRESSGLSFTFNNTDTTTAKSLADSVKSSIEEKFGTSFTWHSTYTEDNYVFVEYEGSGKSDLPGYLEWLMEKCLAPDLGGFSLTFTPMSEVENAFIVVTAFKDSGGYNWSYSMGVTYSTSMQTGSDTHKIDILSLLRVNSLSASEYASYDGWYLASSVSLVVLSNETVSYVSSEPDKANPPTQLRGWHINTVPPPPPIQMMAQFMFMDDPTVDKLSLTFSGLVIPEYPILTSIIVLMLAASAVVAVVKRFRR
jgi:hypothetical protein